jgi:hypothetical protein
MMAANIVKRPVHCSRGQAGPQRQFNGDALNPRQWTVFNIEPQGLTKPLSQYTSWIRVAAKKKQDKSKNFLICPVWYANREDDQKEKMRCFMLCDDS